MKYSQSKIKSLATEFYQDISINVDTLNSCCGFNDIGNFPEVSSITAVFKNIDSDILYDIYKNRSAGELIKKYDTSEFYENFIRIYSEVLLEHITHKNNNYPFIICINNKEQKIALDALLLLSKKKLPMIVYEEVVSGSTGNLLTIFINAESKK